MAGFGVFGGPDDGFGGVGEIAAGEIGRRIGFDPGDVVEELEAELLHGEADGMDDVAGAADPDGAVGFQDALAGGEPRAVEVVVGVGAAGCGVNEVVLNDRTLAFAHDPNPHRRGAARVAMSAVRERLSGRNRLLISLG